MTGERFQNLSRSALRIAENPYVVSITGGAITAGVTGAAAKGLLGLLTGASIGAITAGALEHARQKKIRAGYKAYLTWRLERNENNTSLSNNSHQFENNSL